MDSLLNSRAGKAPRGLRQKHLSHQCQKQQDSLFDRAQPSLELTFLLRQKGHLQPQALVGESLPISGSKSKMSLQSTKEQKLIQGYG